MKSPGTLRSDVGRHLIEKYLPSELQYACRYWAYHLKQAEDYINDNSQPHKFLQEHLLHWLEATSLLGNTVEAIDAVNTLGLIVDVSLL